MDPAIKQFILDTLVGGKEFILSQAPDVVQQYLSSALFENWFVFFIFVVFSIILVMFSIWNYKQLSKENPKFEERADHIGCLVVSVVIFMFLTLPIILMTINSIVKIYLFPKGYLLSSFM